MPTIRVLIVDDSVTIRAVLEQVLLGDPRFEVAGIASSVDDARRMMPITPHDVITLDLAMPGIGGLEFLDELSARRHAPVVVVSSATQTGTEAEAAAMLHGAFACFDKARILSDVNGFRRALRKAGQTKRR